MLKKILQQQFGKAVTKSGDDLSVIVWLLSVRRYNKIRSNRMSLVRYKQCEWKEHKQKRMQVSGESLKCVIMAVISVKMCVSFK